MHGKAHVQVRTNLRVIGLGDGTYSWQNTSNGYVCPTRWKTYEEAEKAAADQAAYSQSLHAVADARRKG